MHFPNEKPTPEAVTNASQAMQYDAHQPTQQTTNESLDIFLYLRILLSNWWLILPLTLAGAGAGYFIWMRTPPVYQAECRIEVLNNSILGQDRDLISRSYGSYYLKRQLVLLEGTQINQEIKNKLLPKWGPRKPPNAKDLELAVRPGRNASQTMIEISVRSFSPDYSLEYIEELLKAYETLRLSEATAVSTSTVDSLKNELSNYEAELKEVEDEIMRFESQHDLIFEAKRTESHQTLLASMLSQKAQIAAQRQMLERQFPFLDESDAATLQEVLTLSMQNPNYGTTGSSATDGDGENSAPSITIQSAPAYTMSTESDNQLNEWRSNEAQILKLTAKYQSLLEVYKPTHPKMQKLEEEIEETKRSLEIAAGLTLKRLRARKDALKMQEEALTSAIEELKKSYVPNTGSRAQYERLRERADTLAKRQDQVFSSIVDLTSSAVDRTIVRVLEPPMSMDDPVWPIRWKIMLASTAASFCGSIGLVLLGFFIKARLYNFSNLEQAIGIRCLAGVQKLSLGRLKRSSKLPIVVNRERDNLVSETFRNLRTSVENALPENARIMMISSPDPAEGKSFLCLNTAVVFSWTHSKVLIIDGDFRKRTISKAFPNAPKRGLVDVMTDRELSYKDCIINAPLPDVAPNLDYLPAGHRRDDTTELLTTPRLREIFDEMLQEYDFIIIDTAPINRVVDSLLLAKQVDAVLLIARSGKTTVPALRYCCSRVGLTNVIGYVLNGIDRNNSRYSYYGSGYHQGSYYYNSYYYKGYYGDSSEG